MYVIRALIFTYNTFTKLEFLSIAYNAYLTAIDGLTSLWGVA